MIGSAQVREEAAQLGSGIGVRIGETRELHDVVDGRAVLAAKGLELLGRNGLKGRHQKSVSPDAMYFLAISSLTSTP